MISHRSFLLFYLYGKTFEVYRFNLTFMKSYTRLLILGCLSLLFFSFSNCKSSSTSSSQDIFQTDPPFTLLQATYQEWTAGTQEGGSGVNVSLTFEPLNQDIIPQQFYFKNQVAEISSNSNNRSQFQVYFKKSGRPDTIMDSDPKQEAQNTPPVKFPFNLKDNEAVLSYLDHDVVLFYKIEKMERKEPLFYPSAPVDEN